MIEIQLLFWTVYFYALINIDIFNNSVMIELFRCGCVCHIVARTNVRSLTYKKLGGGILITETQKE